MVESIKNSPLDALGRLLGAAGQEAGRAVGELGQHVVEDIESVGKAVEKGGFLGGALQFFDVVSLGHQAAHVADAVTGPGALDPRTKEGISAAVNLATGNPMGLKDLVDLFSAPAQPGVRPSPPHGVPPPDLERGERASVPGHADRSGYADSPAPPRRPEALAEVAGSTNAELERMLAAFASLKDDPEVRARYPELYELLNNEDATLGSLSATALACVLRERPEVLDDPALDAARTSSSSSPPSPEAAPSSTPGTAALGGVLQTLGGLLGNPAVSGALGPLLSGLLLATPLAPLAPFVPMLLPLAGQALGALGGALGGGAGATSPAGLTPDAFGALLSGLGGAFGGAATASVPFPVSS